MLIYLSSYLSSYLFGYQTSSLSIQLSQSIQLSISSATRYLSIQRLCRYLYIKLQDICLSKYLLSHLYICKSTMQKTLKNPYNRPFNRCSSNVLALENNLLIKLKVTFPQKVKIDQCIFSQLIVLLINIRDLEQN